MGGFFGVASKERCTLELFYGVDYHSHLGTRRAGMAVYGQDGFQRAIHNIENSPFRTKFEKDVSELDGYMGIGCISDYEPQPLIIQSHLGSFAITTIGMIQNIDDLLKQVYSEGKTHFLEMSGGLINATELVATLICKHDSIIDGIRYVQEVVEGSIAILIMTSYGMYASRDKYGRTPLAIGKKEDAFCISTENFAYLNLGYQHYKELGPAEIVFVTNDSVETVGRPGEHMCICSFLWVYFGYPTSSYEGINVEEMRYRCGSLLAKRDGDSISPDIVAGVPDSGIAHAIGYSNASETSFARPFIKYTPTWPRSFMPADQSQRNLIAKMKLIPVQSLIKDKKLLLIDDSIVRGTQLRETTEFLYESGAKEVHVRTGSPPLLFGCKYLNFSRSKSEMDLITRQIIEELEEEVTPEILQAYADPTSERYDMMVEELRRRQDFTTLRFLRVDDMLEAIGLEPEKVCTYCFTGCV